MTPVGPLKLLSLALDYPDADLLDLRHQMLAEARRLEPAELRELLVPFFAELAALDGLAAQERYVATFDFSRRAALNLTYATQGDRRQRGVALLKLRRVFAKLGVQTVGDELPDYLPLLLELGDALGPDAAVELLAEFRPAIELIGEHLRAQGSPYAAPLAALSVLLGPLDERVRQDVLDLAASGPPSEEVGLEPFAPPVALATSGGPA